MMRPISVYELVTEERRYFSPFCWATRLAIIHKGLPVDTIPWRFRQQEKIAFSRQALVRRRDDPSSFPFLYSCAETVSKRALSHILRADTSGHNHLVPVIVDSNQNGKWIIDSWAIATYLERTYTDGPSLFGGSAGETAALFVQNWFISGPLVALVPILILDEYKVQSADLQPWFRATREAIYGPLEEVAKGETGVQAFRQLLEPMRQTLQNALFLSGKASPSYADIIIFGFFMLSYAVSPTKLLHEDDPLYAWRSRMFGAFGAVVTDAVGFEESI